LSHKLLWNLFEVLLLMMLEGLSADSDFGNQCFCLATGVMFVLLAFPFARRAGRHIPEAYEFTKHSCHCHLVSAVCFFVASYVGPRSTVGFACQCAGVCMQLMIDALFVIVRLGKHPGLAVHMSRTYVTMRIDSLFMEVLGVAVFVPNAIYPGQYHHSTWVLVGDFLAVKLAFSLKACLFDVAPRSAQNHAINLGHIRRLSFFLVAAMILVALCMFGAGVPLLIASVGTHGVSSRDHFCQRLTLGATALFWASSAVMKSLHHYESNKVRHERKVIYQGIGALVALAPLLLPLTDMHVLIFVVSIAQVLEKIQFRSGIADDRNPLSSLEAGSLFSPQKGQSALDLLRSPLAGPDRGQQQKQPLLSTEALGPQAGGH